MSNSFDYQTRLFYSFPNHDTTLTVILNLHFANKNAAMLKPKMEKTVYTGKNEGKNMDTEVTLINYHLLVYFICLATFESDTIVVC